jgi:hypothetical protein
MKKILLLGTFFFLMFLTPRVTTAQPFVGSGFVNPLSGASAGLVNGGFHSHINPLEDHPAYESLERDSYQYEALHGYEHTKSERLQHLHRFDDIQYPKDRPNPRSSYDTFFGFDYFNPLKP